MDNIIACIDGSAINSAVCDAACWVASRLEKPVLLLHTLERVQRQGAGDLSGAIGLGAQTELLEKMAQLDEERAQLALRYAKALVGQYENNLRAAGCAQVDTMLRHGDFVDALVELDPQARLMVVGKSGQDHAAQLTALGSHIETLIRQVQTSILIAPHLFSPPTNFMLAYDGRETADRSLDRVISGGLLQGLECHLVMVKNDDYATPDSLVRAQRRLEAEGYSVKASMLEGPIFDSLQEYQRAQSISLLIMGAFGHSKIRRMFLGSNTIRMIQSASIPLIVLR